MTKVSSYSSRTLAHKATADFSCCDCVTLALGCVTLASILCPCCNIFIEGKGKCFPLEYGLVLTIHLTKQRYRVLKQNGSLILIK